MRANLSNMVVGVSEGFTRKLEINGVGYRAAMQGNKLVLSLGFSHPVEMEVPAGLKVTVENNTSVTITGADKQLLASSPPRCAPSAAGAVQGQGCEIRRRVHRPQGRQEEVGATG